MHLSVTPLFESRPASKQLSIRRLPPLLAVHVKRFEHYGSGGKGSGSGGGGGTAASGSGMGPCGSGGGGGGVARKIQTSLLFSTGQLDMSPYTSAAVLR